MNRFKILGATLLLALSIPAFSQDLWQGAETGMSVEQIKEKFPNVVEPSADDAKYGVSLNIPDYKVGLNNFKVRFLFRENGLERITMENKAGSASVGFSAMQKLLKTKYGEPLDSSSNSLGKNMSWLSNGTTITLLQFMDKLHITYRDNSTETDKL
uniref:hypothetical protein n=1 Tax=Psychrobacter sp. TaxID=56811 RepID=UPI0015995DEC|nr:hypothetical protein [Psychrobacter sp.]QJS05440.1 hypothetical protein [Psychrobacter sp.]